MCFVIIVLFSIKCYAKNLGSYSFTKSEVIRGCSSRFLVVPSAGSFTDNHFQVGSFVAPKFPNPSPLPPPFLDPPLFPLTLNFFQMFPPHYSVFENSIPPFVNGGRVKLWSCHIVLHLQFLLHHLSLLIVEIY